MHGRKSIEKHAWFISECNIKRHIKVQSYVKIGPPFLKFNAGKLDNRLFFYGRFRNLIFFEITQMICNDICLNFPLIMDNFPPKQSNVLKLYGLAGTQKMSNFVS